jgi:hypothetical protein
VDARFWTARSLRSWVRISLDACMYVRVLCVPLSCVGTGLVIYQLPVQDILPKCLKGCIVSEVISDLEQVRGPNP